MIYDPAHHHRRSIRLPGYDYTQPGAYFVTTCTHDGEPLFGEVIDGIMHLNQFGRVLQVCWSNLPRTTRTWYWMNSSSCRPTPT